MRVLIAFLALSLPFTTAPAPAQDEVKWERDLEQAREAAKQTGKPLLVVFRCET